MLLLILILPAVSSSVDQLPLSMSMPFGWTARLLGLCKDTVSRPLRDEPGKG